jgi:hypothetical protein
MTTSKRRGGLPIGSDQQPTKDPVERDGGHPLRDQQLRPGDRPPVTYFELSQRQQPDQAPPSTEIRPLPSSSPWARDPVPPEAPLGYSVEQVADVSKVER